MANTPADNGIPLDNSFSTTPPASAAGGIPLDDSFSTAPDAPQRGFIDRVSDAYNAAAQSGFPGLVARKYNQWFNSDGDKYVRQAFPGQTDEFYSNKKQELIGTAQANLRQEYAQRQEADPAWRPDQSVMRNLLQIDRWGPTLLGTMTGGIGPEAVVAPAGGGEAMSLLASGARVASAAAANAAADSAYQAADIFDNVKKEFDTSAVLQSAAVGGLFQSAFEITPFIRNLFKERGTDTTPGVNPDVSEGAAGANSDVDKGIESPVPTAGRLDPGAEAQLHELYKTGNIDQINDFFTQHPGYQVDQAALESFVANRDHARASGQTVNSDVTYMGKPSNDNLHPDGEHVLLTTEGNVPGEAGNDNTSGGTRHPANDDHLDIPSEGPANDNVPLDESFTEKPEAPAAAKAANDTGDVPLDESFTPEKSTTEAQDTHVNSIVDHVNDLTKDWKNSPQIEVAHSANEISDPDVRQSILDEEKADPSAQITGARGKDGKVYIIGSTLKDPAEATGVLFHEALGHQGLANKFGDDLQAQLTHWYDNSSEFKGDVDEWLDKNPDAYKDAPNRTALAAEEVLAEKSEAGAIPSGLIDRVKNVIKDYARKAGIPLNYSRREIESILAQAHNTVVGSSGVVSRIADSTRFARKKVDENGEPVETHIGNVNLDRIDTLHDVNQILRDAEAQSPDRATVTHAETKQAARDLGIDYNKAIKTKSVGDLAAQMTRLRQVQTDLLDRIAKFQDKMDSGDWTSADQATYISNMSKYLVLHAKIADDKAQIGRALSAMRITSRSNQKAVELLKNLSEKGGTMASLADRDVFERFARTIQGQMANGNTPGANQAIVNLLRPYWEDYLLAGRHAAMLSGLSTHYKNVMDNAGNIARDLQDHAVASIGGNVSKTEVGARAYGLLKALIDGQTYKDTLAAFKQGHPAQQVNSKVQIDQARIPVASKFLDALNAEDTFFRHFTDNMNLYGLGVREAQKQGLSGKAAFARGQQLALNPTEQMLDRSRLSSDRMLMVDTPSRLATRIESAKTRTPDMDPLDRTFRVAAHLMFPFVRVADRMIATKLSRSPAALLGPRFWNEVRGADKATRDTAIARVLFGTTLIGWYAHNAMQGNITPAGGDYKKTQALAPSGYTPSSVHETPINLIKSATSLSIQRDPKGYYDATALGTNINPLDLHNQTAVDVATAIDAYKKGTSAADTFKKLAGAVVQILGNGSFADAAKPYMDAYSEISSGKGAGSASKQLAGSVASSFQPNLLKTANNAFIDPRKRDTKGDGSLTGTVVAHVKDSYPGLSKSLPQKYDVYGQPMVNGKSFWGTDNHQDEKHSAAIDELQRLEGTTPKALITAVPAYFMRNGVKTEIKGQDYAEYQRQTGEKFMEAMGKVVTIPGWQRAPDELKRQAVKEIHSDIAKDIKDKLYPDKDQ